MDYFLNPLNHMNILKHNSYKCSRSHHPTYGDGMLQITILIALQEIMQN